MFSSQIYCVTFVNHRCTGGFTYFTLHFIHATFCIEPRICLAGLLCPTMAVKAQWVTFDPSNLAQSIVNTTRNVVQTTTTAENMVKNFQETVKIYEQGKRYYDALKAVNNLVKDARKVQQTVLLVGEISDIYVNSFQKMLTDGNYTPDELSAIASGYAKMLEESSGMLNEMKIVVTSTGLSMTDKERMDVIDRVYRDVRNQRNLVRYYTNRNIGISYLRAKKKNDTQRVLDLYGTDNQKYW